MHERGLRVNPARPTRSIAEVAEVCAPGRTDAPTLDYDIDGVVVKVDQYQLQRTLGEVDHDRAGDRLQVRAHHGHDQAACHRG